MCAICFSKIDSEKKAMYVRLWNYCNSDSHRPRIQPSFSPTQISFSYSVHFHSLIRLCLSVIYFRLNDVTHYFLAHQPISARLTNDDYSNGFGSESRMSHQPFIISNSVKNSCFWDFAKLQIILKLIQFPNKRKFPTFAKYPKFSFGLEILNFWKFMTLEQVPLRWIINMSHF